jgi:hypothetical protein
MIENDTAILQHKIELWKREIPDYVNAMLDDMYGRKIMPVRKIGADVLVDNIEHYDRTGKGAQIMAKGAVPKGSNLTVTPETFYMYQLLDGFLIHEKDIKADPKLKSREIEIILKNITRLENNMVINGDAAHGIRGIVHAATDNSGYQPTGYVSPTATWATPAGAKYYDDVLKCLDYMDTKFKPRWLLGCQTDINKLLTLSDDTKQPVYQQIANLFGKNPTDPLSSWAVSLDTTVMAAGYVYVIPQNPDAGELVISENPTLRAISQQRGGNYPIEMYAWENIEIHNDDAFVRLKTT